MPMTHDHAPTNFGKAFATGIVLNVAFVLIEAVYGWKAGSLALLADAGHNLSDVAGLMLAWAAFGAAGLRPNRRHTYGWRRGSILASFVNATMLLVAMGSLIWEALHRLQTPAAVDASTVIVVAAVGVVINGVTALMFFSGSKQDLNIRGAFLHMAADSLVSVGVVIAGSLYLWQGWTWIDPVVSLLIALVIIIGTWSLFRRSLHLLFDGVPDDIDLDQIQQSLLELPDVLSVHDLHVWAMSTAENALTAHLICAAGAGNHSTVLCQAEIMLHDRFEIRHTTLQCESPEYGTQCAVNQKNCTAI